MLKHLISLALLISTAALAAPEVENLPLGSGEPARGLTGGSTPALTLPDRLIHVPGYMPGYPTAATIWPRVVQVNGRYTPDGKFVCDGYEITPELGRGEYVFVQCNPEVPVTPPQPAVNTVIHDVVIKEVPVPFRVEVPVKKGKE